MNELTGLLSVMVARDASDLYISAEAPPTLKVDGRFHSLAAPPMPIKQVESLINSVLTDEQRHQFERDLGLDFGLGFPNIGRFRINVYRQKGTPAMVVRYIKSRIPSINELGLPDVLHDLAMEERGLILVVGATGTGKSTTMATMIDYRNQSSAGHILTIEDPIEFIHPHKKSLVSQREVGIDTHSYEDGLRFGLREAPDVVMIGEIRDYDTAKQAIRYAETGHLCLSTMHASNANQALDRLLNFFPADEQRRVQQDLSMHLLAILGQRLAHGLDDKRVTAIEIMMKTPYIAELIDKGETEKIKDAMSSSENHSCQTFDDALYQLINTKRISKQEGMRLADSRINLALRFRLEEDKKETSYLSNAKHWVSSTFDKTHYRSVGIIAKEVSREHRPDMEVMLKKALEQAVIERGYFLDNDKPDLIIKFAFGLHHEKSFETGDIDTEYETGNQSNTVEGGLAIQAKDRRSGNVMWKLVATRPLGQQLRSQQEFNIEIANLLGALPFASH